MQKIRKFKVSNLEVPFLSLYQVTLKKGLRNAIDFYGENSVLKLSFFLLPVINGNLQFGFIQQARIDAWQRRARCFSDKRTLFFS